MHSMYSEVDLRPGQLLAELRMYPPADLPFHAQRTDHGDHGDHTGDEQEAGTRTRAARPPAKMVERHAGMASGGSATVPAGPAMVTPTAVSPLEVASTDSPAPVIVDDPPVLEPPVRPARPASKMISPVAPPAPAPAVTAAPIRSAPTRPAPDPTETVLEIEDGETTLFEAAIGAFHAGEFQRAESLFLEEAERSLDTAPQRAAIAFRQAALAARQGGNADGSDHWMRLAGREYLKVSEDDRTPLPYIREAALMAAKCFLSVENLHVASKGLRRAQAIDSVLRADDDLLAPAPGIPFRHEDTGSTPAVDWTAVSLPADTTAPSVVDGPLTRAESPADVGDGGHEGPSGQGWRRHLRIRRPGPGAV